MAVNPRGTEAYDFALFEPKQPKLVALEPNSKAEKETMKRSRRHSLLSALTVILVAGLVLMAVGWMVYTRVKMTEINDQIIQLQEEFKILDSEEKRLNNQLTSGTSARQVDEYAEQNDMRPLENSQIHYITVTDGDKVEIPENGSKDIWHSIGDFIASIFNP